MRYAHAVTWLVFSIAGALVPGCGDEETVRGGLAAACKLDSDCAEGLVCSSNVCHAVCATSRDCPSGAVCLTVEGRKICEAPDAGGPTEASAGAGGASGSSGGVRGSGAADASVAGSTANGGSGGYGAATGGTGPESGAGGATSTGGAAGTGGRNGAGGTTSTGGFDGGSAATPSAGGVVGTGGASRDSGAGGAHLDSGAGGAPPTTPGCAGLRATCGANRDADCCSSSLIPAGTFDRSGYSSATLSAFRLDTYEVTVGRFRRFAGAYARDRTLSGSGKNPNDSSDPGWDAIWNANLPADEAALINAVKCNATYQTWTDMPGANENRPMNCITWYEAFAFCIWDGGRLPTEAEWNYAAAGGNEQRQYPWSNPPASTSIDCGHANYGGVNPPATACVAPGTGAANDVGSESPAGDGRWGQADLSGNVWEWTLDWYVVPYPSPCTDCAQRVAGSFRVNRGGSFLGDSNGLLSSDRNYGAPGDRTFTGGVRCARTP